jgi:MOSC domain-containing protein
MTPLERSHPPIVSIALERTPTGGVSSMLAGQMATVEAICIAEGGGGPMRQVAEAEAIAGIGLRGDRYAKGTGFYSARPTDPGAREVTLFEAEVLDWLRDEQGITLRPDEHRRNLTVRGVHVMDLLGQRFSVGEVVLEGVRDCPPCEHLEQLTGQAVLPPLVNRGGLRARVLLGGTLRVGDAISVQPRVSA